MPALFIYLLKVNLVLAIFYLAYRFILRPLTFYKVNRAFLLLGIVFSALYPLLDLSTFLQRNPQLSDRLVVIVPDWQAYDRVFVQVGPQQQPTAWTYAEWVFWAGVSVLAIRFCVGLASVYRLHRSSRPARWRQYTYRNVEEKVNPFSFLRYIYLNKAQIDPADLETILSHEKVHADELHTADVILSELATIFYWFNPGAWLTRLAVKENLEFITDQKVLKSGADTRSYQYSLLRMTTHEHKPALVNHFNLLTLKKRIVMMNKKRSSSLQATKYVVLVPSVIALAFVCTVSRAQLETTGRSVMHILDHAGTALGETLTTPAIHAEPVVLAASRADGMLPEIGTLAIGGQPDSIRIKLDGKMDSVKYIIDGKPAKDLATLSGNDIAMIHVAKGETAVRALGPDYADGVVVVTTKANQNSEEVKKFNEQFGITVAGVSAVNGAVVRAYGANDSSRITVRTIAGQGVATGTTSGRATSVRIVGSQGVAQGTAGTAGLEAVTVNGTRIVGATTATAGKGANASLFNNALILINGREATSEELAKVDARDITAIDVIKNPKDTEQYGTRAANGVIRITTKK